jgi:hypothetical protein
VDTESPEIHDWRTPEEEKAYADRMLRFWRELLVQSDRAAAILAAANLETLLEDAIKCVLLDHKIRKRVTLFERLFKNYGPLTTFSAKTDLAFALHLIGPHCYHDLDIIRQIRNDFAHGLEIGEPPTMITFEAQPVASRCANLWWYNSPVGKAPRWNDEDPYFGSLSTARGQYLYSWMQISAGLEIQIGHIKKHPDTQIADRRHPLIT